MPANGPFSGRYLAILAFTLAYLVVGGIAAWMTGNEEFLFYLAVLVALIVVVGAVHARVVCSATLVMALSLWGLLHLAGGLVPAPADWPISGDTRVLYSMWLVEGYLKFDHVVHAYGFGVATWFCWQALRAHLARRENFSPDDVSPTAGTLALCALAGVGLGALNEVIEFAATRIAPETNVGGYANTGWDLVSNLVGAALAAGLIAWGARRRA